MRDTWLRVILSNHAIRRGKWRKRTKADYAAIFEAVRIAIHQFDPYGLLAMACPPDEFDTEIKAIVRQIGRILSPQDAAHVVSRVLGASFEHSEFRPDDCQEVGKHLYQILKERSLLPQ